MNYPKVGSIPRPSNDTTFHIGEKIGQGTFATVFKAIDLRSKKIVALKSINVCFYSK